jgi:FixJ family two-component response regulator
MKQNVVLLIDPDADTRASMLTAAEITGFDIRFAQLKRDLSEITEFELDDVAAIVLDYDPDAHGSVIDGELSRWQPRRPLIFISRGEGLHHPLILTGRAARHLTKPVTANQLAHSIEAVVKALECHCVSCDQWGHPLAATA